MFSELQAAKRRVFLELNIVYSTRNNQIHGSGKTLSRTDDAFLLAIKYLNQVIDYLLKVYDDSDDLPIDVAMERGAERTDMVYEILKNHESLTINDLKYMLN